MIPFLVTGPVDPVVELSDLKQHLHVDHDEHDDLIINLQAAAVAHLDGWNGVIARCIMPQTWAADLKCGRHILPFPDVSEAIFDPDGDNTSVDVELTNEGPLVTLERDGRLQFTCAMPETLIPAAQVAVKMWVADAYKNREASDGGQGIAFQMLVKSLRWWRV